MQLTDPKKAEYIGNGAGTRRTTADSSPDILFSHLLRDVFDRQKTENFLDETLAARTRPRRASSVLPMGFSVPLPVTVGGAPFRWPGRAATESNQGLAERRDRG
jgi:hypothetical protein